MKDDGAQPVGEFGAYIKALRQKRGLTLRQVAEKAGIDHAALARLESSHKVSAVHPATLKGLAGAYDIPLAELLRHVGYEIITPDTSTYLHQCYPCLPETAIAAVRAHIERLVARYDADAKATASSPDAP